MIDFVYLQKLLLLWDVFMDISFNFRSSNFENLLIFYLLFLTEVDFNRYVIIIVCFVLQLRENTLFPDGSSVEFRCHEQTQLFPGHDYALEGNSTLTCHDGHWNSRLPYCRKTASSRANYSGTYPSVTSSRSNMIFFDLNDC